MNNLVEARPTPNRGTAAFATRPVESGELLGKLTGPRLTARTRYSIERDGVHYDPDAPLRFMNHACTPSARWVGFELRALRALQAGDEVTFDYTETESAISSPFPCHCGSAECRAAVGAITAQAPIHSSSPGAS